MKHHTTAVTHPAHNRLLELKLKGANHLARVLDSNAPEPTRLKAAMALARMAIPAAALPPLPLPAGEGRGEGENAAAPQTSAAATSVHDASQTDPQSADPQTANTTAPATFIASLPLACNDPPSPARALAAKHVLLQRNFSHRPGAAVHHRPRIEATPPPLLCRE